MNPIIELPPPNLLGAPERYSKWRHIQSAAVSATVESTKRFNVIGAPTGSGKSLIYVTSALLSDARTVILTSTKALQAQLWDDFRESGMLEIKGMNAYECVEGRTDGMFGDMRREGFRADKGMPMMCDEAPCQSGVQCYRRGQGNGCEYYEAYYKAGSQLSRLIVTNYAYWMSIHRFGEGLGHVDLLVLDEAHNAVDELGRFIGTDLRPFEVGSILLNEANTMDKGADLMDWKAWGQYWLAYTVSRLESLKSRVRQYEADKERIPFGILREIRELKKIQRKLETISSMKGDWVIDWTKDSQDRDLVKFDPVWPGEYAEQSLFLGVPKVVMVSATVRPKTAQMLGIMPHELDFREYPSTFPKQNRPVIYHPTAHMNKSAVDSNGMQSLHQRIDQIISRREDRKGIIHTVSYPRARAVYKASEYRERMLIHDSLTTRDVIKQFKLSRDPLVLVSPVLDTGYDFPFNQAEFQIIIKVPFPVSVDNIFKARQARDSGYRDYVTMVTLVQMAGRICRAEDDRGETIILDADFGWWYYGRGCKLAPNWFNEAVRQEQILWMPPPKLGAA